MDIKPVKPTLSQETNAALDQKSGFSDLPSLLSQFTIRTMDGDLKNAAAQAAAKLAAAKTVAPSTAPRGKQSELYGVAPTPYLKTALPQQVQPAIKGSNLDMIFPPPPKEIVELKTPLITAPPAPKVEDAKAQKAKEARKLKQEQKAAKQAAKEAQKKLELENKASQAAATAAAKEAAQAAKEKILKEKKAQEQEMRGFLAQAKLKLAAKEFNAAIVDAQKIADNLQADWFAKWQAKRLINKAQKEIGKKTAEPKIISIPPTIVAPPKPAPVPVNLPTADEVPPVKPAPPTPTWLNPPVPPTPQPSKPAPTATPTPLPPAPKSAPFPTNIPAPAATPSALPRDDKFYGGEQPEETLDMKKIALVALTSIAVLALIVGGLWYFLQTPGQPITQISQSPSPRPSAASPAPIIIPAPLFTTDSQKIFALKTDQEKATIQETVAQLAQTDEPAGNFIYLLFKDAQGNWPSLAKIASSAANDLFDLPTQTSAGSLKNQLDLSSFSFFAYSQSQPDSSPFISGTNLGRFGLVISIKNATSTSTQELAKSLKDLEQLMLPGLEFLLPGAKNSLPTKPIWLDSAYSDVAIRYVNLPEPSLSLDYAILNNKLIFATSKASMYAIIDRVLSQTNP